MSDTQFNKIPLKWNSERKEFVVIGAGFAGMTCALYLARAGKKVTVFGDWAGSSIVSSPAVENFPGTGKTDGVSILYSLFSQISEEENITLIQEEVKEMEFLIAHSAFGIYLDGQSFLSPHVIIATGRTPKTLNIEGEKELLGNGKLSTCAYCDGSLFKNQKIAIIGGGTSAIEEAIYLSSICSEVEILVRKNRLQSKELQTKILPYLDKNVKILFGTELKSLVQSEDGASIIATDKNGKKHEWNGLFYAIGSIPNTDFIKINGICTEEGYIKTFNGMVCDNQRDHYSLAVCGDVSVRTQYKQAIVACADGASVALEMLKHL